MTFLDELMQQYRGASGDAAPVEGAPNAPEMPVEPPARLPGKPRSMAAPRIMPDIPAQDEQVALTDAGQQQKEKMFANQRYQDFLDRPPSLLLRPDEDAPWIEKAYFSSHPGGLWGPVNGFLEGLRRDLRLGDAAGDMALIQKQLEEAQKMDRAGEDATLPIKLMWNMLRMGLANAIGREGELVERRGPGLPAPTGQQLGELGYGLTKLHVGNKIARGVFAAVGVTAKLAAVSEGLPQVVNDATGFGLATATEQGATPDDVFNNIIIGGIWGRVGHAANLRVNPAALAGRVAELAKTYPTANMAALSKEAMKEFFNESMPRNILLMGGAGAALGGPTLSEKMPGESDWDYHIRQGIGAAVLTGLVGYSNTIIGASKGLVADKFGARVSAPLEHLIPPGGSPHPLTSDEYFSRFTSDMIRDSNARAAKRQAMGDELARISAGREMRESRSGEVGGIDIPSGWAREQTHQRLKLGEQDMDVIVNEKTRDVYAPVIEHPEMSTTYARLSQWAERTGHRVLLPTNIPDTPLYHTRTVEIKGPGEGFEQLLPGSRADANRMYTTETPPGTLGYEETNIPLLAGERQVRTIGEKRIINGEGSPVYVPFEEARPESAPEPGRGPGGYVTPTQRLFQEVDRAAREGGRRPAKETELRSAAEVYEKAQRTGLVEDTGPLAAGHVVKVLLKDNKTTLGPGELFALNPDTGEAIVALGSGNTMPWEAQSPPRWWRGPATDLRRIYARAPRETPIVVGKEWVSALARLEKNQDITSLPLLQDFIDRLSGMINATPYVTEMSASDALFRTKLFNAGLFPQVRDMSALGVKPEVIASRPDIKWEKAKLFTHRDRLAAVEAMLHPGTLPDEVKANASSMQRAVSGVSREHGKTLARTTKTAGAEVPEGKGEVRATALIRRAKELQIERSAKLPPSPDVTRAIRGEASFPDIANYEEWELATELSRLSRVGWQEGGGKPPHVLQRMKDLTDELDARQQPVHAGKMLEGSIYIMNTDQGGSVRIIGQVPNNAPALPAKGYTVFNGELSEFPSLPGGTHRADLYYTAGNTADIPGMAYELRKALEDQARVIVTDTGAGTREIVRALRDVGFEPLRQARVSGSRVVTEMILNKERMPKEETGLLDAMESTPFQRATFEWTQMEESGGGAPEEMQRVAEILAREAGVPQGSVPIESGGTEASTRNLLAEAGLEAPLPRPAKGGIISKVAREALSPEGLARWKTLQKTLHLEQDDAGNWTVPIRNAADARRIETLAMGRTLQTVFESKQALLDYFAAGRGESTGTPEQLLRDRVERLGLMLRTEKGPYAGRWVLERKVPSETWPEIHAGYGKDSLGKVLSILETHPRPPLPAELRGPDKWIQEALETGQGVINTETSESGQVSWNVFLPPLFQKRAFSSWADAESFLAVAYPGRPFQGRGAAAAKRLPLGSDLYKLQEIAERLRMERPAFTETFAQDPDPRLLRGEMNTAYSQGLRRLYQEMNLSRNEVFDLQTYLNMPKAGSDVAQPYNAPADPQIVDKAVRGTIFHKGVSVRINPKEGAADAFPGEGIMRPEPFTVTEVLPEGKVRIASPSYPDEGPGSLKRGLTVPERSLNFVEDTEVSRSIEEEYWKRQRGTILTPMTGSMQVYLGNAVEVVKGDADTITVRSTQYPNREVSMPTADLKEATPELLRAGIADLEAVRQFEAEKKRARKEVAGKTLESAEERARARTRFPGKLTRQEAIVEYGGPTARERQFRTTQGPAPTTTLYGFTQVTTPELINAKVTSSRSTPLGEGLDLHLDPERTSGGQEIAEVRADVSNPLNLAHPANMEMFRNLQVRLGSSQAVTAELRARGYDSILGQDLFIVLDPSKAHVQNLPGISKQAAGSTAQHWEDLLATRNSGAIAESKGVETLSELEDGLIGAYTKEPQGLREQMVRRLADEVNLGIVVHPGESIVVYDHPKGATYDISGKDGAAKVDATWRMILKRVALKRAEHRMYGGITGPVGPGGPGEGPKDDPSFLEGKINLDVPPGPISMGWYTQTKDTMQRLAAASGYRWKTDQLWSAMDAAQRRMSPKLHESRKMSYKAFGKLSKAAGERAMDYIMTPVNLRQEAIKTHGFTQAEMDVAKKWVEVGEEFVRKFDIRTADGDLVDWTGLFSEAIPSMRKQTGKLYPDRAQLESLPRRMRVMIDEQASGEFNIIRDKLNAHESMTQAMRFLLRAKHLKPALDLGEAMLHGRDGYPQMSEQATKYVGSYLKMVKHTPDGLLEDVAGTLDNAFRSSFGLNVGAPVWARGLHHAMLWNYYSNIPLRAGIVMKQVLEGAMKVLPVAGAKIYGEAMVKHLTPENIRGAVKEGIIPETLLPDFERSAFGKIVDLTYLPMRAGDVDSRLQAFYAGGAMLRRGVKKATNLDGSINIGKAVKASGLDGILLKSSLLEIFQHVARGDISAAEGAAGRHLSQDLMGLYRTGESPYMMHNLPGKAAGQYGQFSMNYATILTRMATMGDGKAVAMKMARWTAVNAALGSLALRLFGSNDLSWLFFGPAMFLGGPAVRMASDVLQLTQGRMSVDDPRKRMILKRAAQFAVTQATPYSGFIRDAGYWPGQDPSTGVANQFTNVRRLGAALNLNRYNDVLLTENPLVGEQLTPKSVGELMQEYRTGQGGSGQTQSPAPQGKSNLKR